MAKRLAKEQKQGGRSEAANTTKSKEDETHPQLVARNPSPDHLARSPPKSHPVIPPSALSTAKYIKKLEPTMYPEGIQCPKIELNVNADDDKFRSAFLESRNLLLL